MCKTVKVIKLPLGSYSERQTGSVVEPVNGQKVERGMAAKRRQARKLVHNATAVIISSPGVQAKRPVGASSKAFADQEDCWA